MKIKATKKQLIAALTENNISRQIDKMELHRQDMVISLENAATACKEDRKRPQTTIHVKTYVSNRPSTYGHQFLSAVWITIDGKWYQASGGKTSGCGYDKVSTAIGSALRAVGIDNYIDGTGQHEEFLQLLGKKLLGRKPFFMI